VNDKNQPHFLKFKLLSYAWSEYTADVEIFIPSYAFYEANAGIPQVTIKEGGITSQSETFKNILITGTISNTTYGGQVWLQFYADNASRSINISTYPGSSVVTWTGQTTTAPSNIQKTVPFLYNYETKSAGLNVLGTLRLSGSTSGYVGFSVPANAGSTTYLLPSADGTSGQVLSTNSTGTLSWATPASGGPTQVTFAESTAAPNATVYVDSITAAATTTNADLALRPKGTGALTAHVADGTATGGNKRGANAVDWQTGQRTNAMNVASGAQSTAGGGKDNRSSGAQSTIAGGWINVASGAQSTVGGGVSNNATGSDYATVAGGASNTASGYASVVAGGKDNTASGSTASVGGGQTNSAANTFATVGGGRNNYIGGIDSTISGGSANTIYAASATIAGGEGHYANGIYSTIPGGYRAKTDQYGKYAYASGYFGTSGDAQFGLLILRGTTADAATARVLTADGLATASATNTLVLGNNKVYSYRIELVANSAAVGSGTVYGTLGGNWSLSGLIRRTADAASTALIGTPAVAYANIDSAIGACVVALTANTTLGGLAITVNGIAATNIHWVAVVTTTEVG